MSEEEYGAGPLAGLVVVDFTRMLSGPFCAAILADMGAEVIKIEAPHGDDQRAIGAMKAGHSISFEILNRSKQSLRLDMKTSAGRDLALRLAARADIVLENFRPGVADKLGIGYEAVRAERPDTIYCSISGFGQSGPMAQAPSYDVIAQALSGMMSLTGTPATGPLLVGDSIGDSVAGVYAAMAISTALYRRAATGAGSRIDVAMFDSLFSLLPTALANWQMTGTAPEPTGNRHPFSAPFGVFEAGDGPFLLAVASDKLFADLARTIGHPDLPADPRFASDTLRGRNREALRALIEDWSHRRSAAEAISTLEAAGIPASTIWDVAQAATSPQVTERGLMHRLAHPALGTLALPEQPIHFSGVPRRAPRRAPELGADATAILSEHLGLCAAEIASLKTSGVI